MSGHTPFSMRNNKLLLVALMAILLMVNFPLSTGGVQSQLIFFPDAVLTGQWWRVITHPFVHLSWYHLVLDGLAFIILFFLLEEKSTGVRLFYSITAGLGALLFGLLLEPSIYQLGLCGLSGVAHGLMAISAVEMLQYKEQRGIGGLCLVLVLLKCVYELYSGQVVLESLHMGQTGQPLAASHAGGVMGGLVAFGIMKCKDLRIVGRYAGKSLDMVHL